MKGLVEGIVTEDSDVFLFGGRHVYRGVFQNDVKFYSMDKIKKEIGMNRLKCIIFAMFLGSDYTEGVKGVGIVNAMEILRVFDTIEKVQRLREWARLPDELVADHNYKGCTPDEIEFFEFHKNFKKYWYMEDDFPNLSAVNEYLTPHVEAVSQPFKFNAPDLQML
jgi:DNA excision repair protein ERCC-5